MPSKYPDYNACLDLLRIKGCKENVIRHIETVHRFSMIIGNRIALQGYSPDLELLEAGALLHDIGRSRRHDIRHAIEGAEIAAEIGLPQDLINIIINHIGAGLTKEDAVLLGLPVRDYIPFTLEQKIVAAADNLTRGSEFQSIEEHVKDLRRKGLNEGAERSMSLHRELSELCGIDLDDLILNETGNI